MDINSVLLELDNQKKNENVSTKLYRYLGLIKAIEFFSNRLTIEHIIQSIFDFISELLLVQKAAIFIKENNKYILKKCRGYDISNFEIENTRNLDNIAVFCGSVLTNKIGMLKYFSEQHIDEFDVKMIIPLIVDTKLYGFIFTSGKIEGNFEEEDIIISDVLMKIFNNSIENNIRYNELKDFNKILDEKIFNLYAINQSTKALLSELNLDNLYNLSVDVFSELTRSSSTSFILFDDNSRKYRIVAYKSISSSNEKPEVFLSRNETMKIIPHKIVLNLKNESDITYFNSLFKEGIDSLKALSAEYIVLLLKNNKILGFVTLGKKFGDSDYENSIFELVESLSTSTYIAISNALLFKTANEQKEILIRKNEILITLNNLIKKINQATKINSLLQITTETLVESFGVEKCLIALFDHNKKLIKIQNTAGFKSNSNIIELENTWNDIIEGSIIFESDVNGIYKYFDAKFVLDIGDIEGTIIVPISLESVQYLALGAIVIFKTRTSIINSEENMLIYENIAGHIAPSIRNLATIEEHGKSL